MKVKKVRFTVRAAAVAFTSETATAFAEIAIACGATYAVRLCMHNYQTQDCATVVLKDRGTAKRLHTLACEFDPQATLSEG